jgi:hypothetical protein
LLKEFSEEDISKLFSDFSCPLNTDVQDFLINKSLRFEESDKARTYLILSEITGNILGYFSLSFKELSVKQFQVSKTKIRRLDGISKEADKINTYLIGQIGKNYSDVNNTLNLKNIMESVWVVINEARALIGGRVVILECQNIDKLVALYETEGFTLLVSPSSDDKLLTLYTIVTT